MDFGENEDKWGSVKERSRFNRMPRGCNAWPPYVVRYTRGLSRSASQGGLVMPQIIVTAAVNDV